MCIIKNKSPNLSPFGFSHNDHVFICNDPRGVGTHEHMLDDSRCSAASSIFHIFVVYCDRIHSNLAAFISARVDMAIYRDCTHVKLPFLILSAGTVARIDDSLT